MSIESWYPQHWTQHPGVVPQVPNSREEAQGGVSLLCCKDSSPTPSPPAKGPSCHRGLFQPKHHNVNQYVGKPLPDSGGSSLGCRPTRPQTKARLAPHLCTTRRDSRFSAGVDCWSAEKRFKVLVAGRPESDAGCEKRGVSEFGTSPVQEPPGEGSPLPPHAAYLNLQASHQTLRCCLCPSSAARPAQRAGCWSQWIQAAGGETESALNPTPRQDLGQAVGRLPTVHPQPHLGDLR